ncbi:N-terminal kinase-like protein isoform X1 [Parasteatoda tepidariorum]|uniref:N-terminal kinase-like protein isoform X1 n=1 Tax=Parasteatoda tepidariorum TaxID=114398 RepID=UPI001C71A319|nr:N-terminal kinase-like protein isoform X1 [Parasteatoda tepidariorum]
MWSFFSRDAAKDFAFELGAEVEGLKDYSIWKLHSGKKKASGEAVSIFVFENSSPETASLLEIAKSALKRLKTLRHPSILTYVDSLETDKLVYLVVEPVEPLELHLNKNSYTADQKNLAISWGLYQIASGLSFLNNDCHLSHNNVCLSSVFVDRAGEWKLFGLEYIAPESYPVKVLPSLQIYNPPEQGSNHYAKESSNSWACDSWGFGCLIWEVFNSRLSKISSLKNTGKIPNNLCPFYCELVCANPDSRPSSSTFLKKASKAKGYFKNKFVDTMLFLREIHIKDTEEKLKFFNNLSSSLDSFPQDICLYKVLPELVNAFEFGNAGSSVLTPMFKLGKLLPEDEYQKKIVPCIVKMFSSKDRATRAKLLQQVEQFIDHIQPSVINNQIFPNIAQGFLDTNPTIRDQTIKCMMYLAPKLNYQNLNDEMLKHFARLQSKDEQGGIRTNTTVCLGKIASYLHPQTRKKVLIAAFLRALRDPFPPARTAAILALSATEHYYSINDCATKVLPALCHFTVDPEKDIRDQAFKGIGGFLTKLQKVSDDPSLIEKMEAELQSTTPASIAASWTSWAVTSLTDKFYKSNVKSQNNPSPQSDTPSAESAAEKLEELSVKSEKTTKDDNSWNDNWGDEEEDSKAGMMSLPSPSTISPSNENDGWEDEWESLETDNNVSKNTERLKTFFHGDSEDPFSTSTFEMKAEVTKEMSPSTPETGGDWNTDSWDNWESSTAPKTGSISERNAESLQQKKEANRMAREERRKQKLKERQLARPVKLGAQKISSLND